MESAKKRINHIFKAIERMVNFLETMNAETPHLQFQCRLEKLEQYFTDFSELITTIADDSFDVDNKTMLFETTYFTLVSSFRAEISKRVPITNNNNTMEQEVERLVQQQRAFLTTMNDVQSNINRSMLHIDNSGESYVCS